MTPTEERAAWQLKINRLRAAWPVPGAQMTVVQARAQIVADAAAWTPNVDPALLHGPEAHKNLNQSGVKGEWSLPTTPRGMILYVHGATLTGTIASYRRWADVLAIASGANVLNLD